MVEKQMWWVFDDNLGIIFHKKGIPYVPRFSDRSGQTVQTQIRLLLRVYTVCNSLCIFWMHYSKEKPSCSTFRVITANFRVSEFLGIIRYILEPPQYSFTKF